MHPLNEAWRRLPAGWTSASLDPALPELVKLQAELGERWLIDPIPTSEEIERDLEECAKLAREHGADVEQAQSAMQRSYSTLSQAIWRRVTPLSPLLGSIYLGHAAFPLTLVLRADLDDDQLESEFLRSLDTTARCLEFGVNFDPLLLAETWHESADMEFVTEFLNRTRRDGGDVFQLTDRHRANIIAWFKNNAVRAKPIGSEIERLTALDRGRLDEEMQRVRQFDVDTSDLTVERVVAERMLAAAVYFQISGQNDRAIEMADAGIKALLEPYETGEKDEVDGGDFYHLLKLVTARAEAAVALGQPALDETAIDVMTLITPATRRNWLDLMEPWTLERFAKLAIMHIGFRLLTLASGHAELIPGTTKGDRKHLPGSWETSSTASDQIGHILNINLDILGTLQESRQDRPRRVEEFLRSAIPDWQHLRDDTQALLRTAELDYRRLVAAEAEDPIVYSTGALYARALEAEVGDLDRDNPLICRELRQLRNDAIHKTSRGFSERKLTRMRSYLFDIEAGAPGAQFKGVFARVASEAKRRALKKPT